MWKIDFWVIFANLVFCGTLVSATTVIAPRALRSKSNFSVSVSTLNDAQIQLQLFERAEPNSNKSFTFTPNDADIIHDPYGFVPLAGPKRQISQRQVDSLSTDLSVPITLVQTKAINAPSNASQLVVFNINQKVQPGSYVLQARSLSPEHPFNQTKFLYVRSKSFSVFIQTNKAAYRPGEEVNYRVLIVDSNTLPINLVQNLKITIYDPLQNMISLKSGLSAPIGVYVDKYQIPAGNSHGVWEIEVEYQKKRVRKSIEVFNIEQVNFQVGVKTRRCVQDSRRFYVDIDAKYLFGKPVAGSLTVKATPILQIKDSWAVIAKPLVKSNLIFGRFEVHFDIFDFQLPEQTVIQSILIETTVKEAATGTIGRGHDKTIQVTHHNESKGLAKPLHVEVLDKNWKPNNAIKFKVESKTSLKSLSYYIVGRGNVLVSETVNFGGKTSGIFEFNPAFTMAPVSSLVVFYETSDGTIVSDKTEFKYTPEDWSNSFSVSVPNTEFKPNDDLDITIKTSSDSFIALSGVDQIVSLTKRGNDLTRTRVFNDLRLYDSAGDIDVDESYTASYIKMLEPGTIVMTDAKSKHETINGSSTIRPVRKGTHFDYCLDIVSDLLTPKIPHCKLSNTDKNVRSMLSETLVWEEISSGTEETTLKVQFPSTITSWQLSGYGLSPTNGLGVLKNPILLTTFKPFFIDINLPVSVQVNQIIRVPVVIHNYLDHSTKVQVRLFDTRHEFEIISEDRHSSKEYENEKIIHLLANSVKSTTFTIKPKKTGLIRVKVEALAHNACDTLQKYLRVKPEGITIYRRISQPLFLNDTNSNPTKTTIVIDVPENAIPDSVQSQFTVQGDIYTLDLENLKPSGTSTDGNPVLTFVNMVSNLGVSAATGVGSCNDDQYNATADNSLSNYLAKQCADSGLQLDGDCDQPGRSTSYTTSYIYFSAPTAGPATIPQILKACDWLASIQNLNGSFSDPTPFPPDFLQGRITTSLVAFTLSAAGQAIPEILINYKALIDRAMDNIFGQITKDIHDETFTLSYIAVAALLNNDSRAKLALNLLNQTCFENKHTKFWITDQPFTYWRLVLNAYILDGDIISAFKTANGITRFLVENGQKFIESDQVAISKLNFVLYELAYFYQTYFVLDPRIQVTFSSEPAKRETVNIDKTNRFLLNKFVVDPNLRLLEVESVGKGLVNLELTYQYNLDKNDVRDAYNLTTKVVPVKFVGWQLNVCVSFKHTPCTQSTTMEIKFPPGFNTTEYVRNVDPMTANIVKKELTGNGMTVSFENLTKEPSCVEVPLSRQIFASQPLIGSVVVYDTTLNSNNPNWSTTKFVMPRYDATIADDQSL